MAEEGQTAREASPKVIMNDATINDAPVANVDGDNNTRLEDRKMSRSPLPNRPADRSEQEGKTDADPQNKSPSRSPSRERKRRSRSRSRSRTRRRSRSPRDRRRRSDRRSDRRSGHRSRSRSRGRRDRDRERDRRDRRSRSPRDRRGDRHRSRSRDRRRRRRSPSSSRSRSRSRGRQAYPSGGAAAATIAASMFPNMMPGGMNPMTATMPNMPNLQTVQMQNMAAAVGAMAGIALPGQPGMPIPAQATRSQRRLYVGGIPNPCFDFQLIEFLGSTLIALGLVANTGRLPIYKAEITQERSFAFVEFWDVADCTACLQLDGIIYSGQALKIRRPKDYIMPYGSFDPPPLGPVAIATLLAQKTGTQPPPGLMGLPMGLPSPGGAAVAPPSGGVGGIGGGAGVNGGAPL